MTAMKGMKKYLLPLVAGLCFVTACQSGDLSSLRAYSPGDSLESISLFGAPSSVATREKMVVNQVDFAPDYKTFSVWTGVVEDIGPYPLTDSTKVRIEVEEYDDGVRTSRRVCPRLVGAFNTEAEQIEATGTKVLVLVDLALSQEAIDAQRNALEEMATAFDRENLYVAFMSGEKVTPSRLVSKYILGSYFVKRSSEKYLYRSVLEKIQEMSGRPEPWADARQLKLVVFSDGEVYGHNEEPLDPKHFRMESELLHANAVIRREVNCFYVNFGTKEDSDSVSDAANVLTSLCETSGGIYMPAFNWTVLEKAMLGESFLAEKTNRFDFVNPDGKVYRGNKNKLRLKFYSVKENRLIASATASIQEGKLYRPVIVNGDSLGTVILEGVSIGLLIMLAIYLVCQFLIPYIRYRLFRKKYVMRHTGRAMVIGDLAVAESCYLCKAPFEEGDEIVVKCEHTMHRHCWDENEYHCPEYGRHCAHGSHFYNKENLFDGRNATFYQRWLLFGVQAAILAWIAFSIWTSFVPYHILEYLVPLEKLKSESSGIHLNQLPSSSFMISFFLTSGIALLAIRRRRWLSYLDVILRALLTGVLSAIFFLLVSLACIALNLQSVSFLLNLIPWVLSSYLIVVMGTYGSRVKRKKYMVLAAVAVCLVSMNVWSSIYMFTGIDFRVLLLYSFMIYTVGISLSIATVTPHSEHYFLQLQGAVKTMDVALYKWFRANPNAVVSIGRSVNCSLQLSWDLKGDVAPVHAEITMNRGVIRLKALEEGVLYQGKPLPIDHYKTLCQGSRFQIGQTIFIYQEKDL